MSANTPPKPHTEGMEWTNAETGIKYQFAGGAWRAVSSQALEDVIDLIENAADIFYGDSPPTDEKYELWFDTKRTELCVKHEDMWMPASIGGAGNGDNGVVPTLEQVLQAGPFADIPIVLTDGEEAFIDVDPRENRLLIAGADVDGVSGKPPRISLIHLTSDSDGQGRADIELDEGGKRLDFEMFSGVDNIHFRFEEDEKFIINKQGDAEFIGRVKASPAISDDEIVTYAQLKTYIEPEFYRYMWDPTITNFNSYTNGNQDASAGQLCSMTGPVEDAVWHYIADKDLDGNLLRAPMVSSASHGSFDLEVYVESAGVYLQPPYVDVYPDGKEFKKRFTVEQCQRSKAVAPPPVFSVYYPWLEINGMAVNWTNEFWAVKRELFIKVK